MVFRAIPKGPGNVQTRRRIEEVQIRLLVQPTLFRSSVLEICRQIGESSEKNYKNDTENGGTDLRGEIKVTKNPEPGPGNDFREQRSRRQIFERCKPPKTSISSEMKKGWG